MTQSSNKITIDGRAVCFQPGQTIMEAATEASVYIPHLCHHPDYPPHGSCKVCTVKVDGRYLASCSEKAVDGMEVQNNCKDLKDLRRSITQLLFVDGNHYCPSCERSGNCQLQAIGYALEMQENHYTQLFPTRKVDASHPDIILDPDRCILCGLCVRASEAEGKNLFKIGGRGQNSYLSVCSDSGLLGDSSISVNDKAAQICPVGAILIRGEGFHIPIGERLYDHQQITSVGNCRPRYNHSTSNLTERKKREGPEHSKPINLTTGKHTNGK
ncbi:2Fe-2S iron-sulfur cluster-binding protein [Motiliproteus sp. MSK22-1]|uniref:2Fe-2S iron-sulfur cluster-binding protein n=1 Tax=Motiliproteus sp. MSK22-1 TaxID=1897630 RepID=UPI000978A2AF|nr:2Fe-2S iron-sulfur cluster-binding protein [Motiliproteus sp. MSK22-1]OMH32713.1 NADP oxidoreductase [Motiliproteus sp. MSK22-1]